MKICVNCNHSRLVHNRVGKYCLECWKACDFLPAPEEYVRHRQRLIVQRYANRVVKFLVVSENGSEQKVYRFTRKFFDEVFLPQGGWKKVETHKTEAAGALK